jgi:ubiquinone/menaquinone biosynthesis C-methylase UbiE
MSRFTGGFLCGKMEKRECYSRHDKIFMPHIFSFSEMQKLEDPARQKLIPAYKILVSSGLKEGMQVADIGCGTGFFAFPASDIVGGGGFVWGVDSSEEFLAYCTHKAVEKNITNVSFVAGDAGDIPLQNESVDIVIVSMVLHEVEEKAKVLQEIARIVRPGGKVVFVEWKKIETPQGPPLDDRLDVKDIETYAVGTSLERVSFFDLNAFHYGALFTLSDVEK